MNLQTKLLYFILAILIIVSLIIIINYAYNFIKKIETNKSFKKQLGQSTRIRVVYQLKEAIEYLAKTKTGAIITIENKDNLDLLRTDGIIIDANISSSLIITIFNKHTPLHDGAIIIRNNKIYYAATYYKITKKSIDNRYGARHRAAMGISELCDATTIVVSEETGGITIAKNGLFTSVSLENLQGTLFDLFKDTE
ncbi:DNA integrity scanning protein DisA nucleotide-binding domain protein [Metamycoplasma equirhinis]|uniref:DNA integrity scanning protein DisA nucleotide-binding domain protein n=1 Tax=Metamycoplasma equirhinis TaxID=92402 RepID=A0ABZ0PAW8_9BACT|nr:DNA integrity scanning protein DisA nucleotide-binding domain protein [Metamycoplasma equirhinis]TPD98261.1 diadenylate cyclase [Metamycoplasma equirhinis]WPB54099.1 DNA integrity scanning protein DisA nucleotide-binding domain protein [Metamycoplasma equirhinis]